ncbi:hypothetical protein B4U84_23130, partial [Westiellopsis prolifica IICB1]
MLVRKNNGDRGAGSGERESGIGDKRAREQGIKGSRGQGVWGVWGVWGELLFNKSLPNAQCPMPHA